MISIVVPLYNEKENIENLVNAIEKNLKQEHEILFVDDGSTDGSFELLKELKKKNSCIRVIRFGRNFGQTAALDSGFKNAKGDIIISMDADLQNDPVDIPMLLSKLNEGVDFVVGWRKKRSDSIEKRFFSKIRSILARTILSTKFHDIGCTLRAYKMECLQDISLYGQLHRYIPIILEQRGYKGIELEVKHHKRKKGTTKYGFSRLLYGFLDMLFLRFWASYSSRPLHFFGLLGVAFGAVGVLIAVYKLLLLILFSEPLVVGPLLLAGVLFILVGFQLFALGFLGEMITRVYYTDKETYHIKEEV
ncbi:glycosyltransferase family 2 protein [Candidatus Micrarchaeota archaeon]|nr:glycosyltransferase family 2 protein [Candidatus Micrarchaeota archaeon]